MILSFSHLNIRKHRRTSPDDFRTRLESCRRRRSTRSQRWRCWPSRRSGRRGPTRSPSRLPTLAGSSIRCWCTPPRLDWSARPRRSGDHRSGLRREKKLKSKLLLCQRLREYILMMSRPPAIQRSAKRCFL